MCMGQLSTLVQYQGVPTIGLCAPGHALYVHV